MTSSRHFAFAAAVCVALGNAPVAHAEPSVLPAPFAYDYGETETARSAGIGAMHALGGGVTAIFLNPANLGLTRSYHLGALGQFTPEAGRHLYGGAVMDSTRRFSGGVSFVGGFQDPDGLDRSIVDSRVAMGFAVSKGFLVGLGGRLLDLRQGGLGPLGPSRASGGLVVPDGEPGPGGAPARKRMLSSFTFDAGVTLRPIDSIAIAAYGHNLSYPNHGLLPTIVGGGVGFGTAELSLEADVESDLTSYGEPSWRVMAGGEYLALDRVPIRLGYRFDALGQAVGAPSHAVSGGLGYLEPRFGVEASVRRTVTGPSATMMFVGISYFVDSLGSAPETEF